jgi:hypothetical protein
MSIKQALLAAVLYSPSTKAVKTTTSTSFWRHRCHESRGHVQGSSSRGGLCSSYSAASPVIYVSGLTPDNSYTWKWGWRVSAGTSSHVSGGTDGPSSMLVYDAGPNVIVNNTG